MSLGVTGTSLLFLPMQFRSAWRLACPPRKPSTRLQASGRGLLRRTVAFQSREFSLAQRSTASLRSPPNCAGQNDIARRQNVAWRDVLPGLVRWFGLIECETRLAYIHRTLIGTS